MNLTKKILFYGVFAFIALLVSLYLRFPSDLIRQILMDQVELAQPDAHIETDDIALMIPPGIRMTPLMVSYADIPIIRMDTIKVAPHLSTIIRDIRRFGLKGQLGNGELKGTAEAGFEDDRQHGLVTLNLTRVPLDYIEILNQWPSFISEGAMDANIKFDALRSGGTAEISMEVSPAKVTLDPPIMGIETLEFSRLKAQLTATARMIQIRNCEASGDQIEGKINGSIILREPMENSRITLSLTLKPQPAFLEDHKGDMIGGLLATGNAQKRGIVFRISGTLANPRYVIR